MSGLLRQPVNPIQQTQAPAAGMADTYPVPRDADQPNAAPDVDQVQDEVIDYPTTTRSATAQVPAVGQRAMAVAPTLSAGATLPPEEDGFDDIAAGFGAHDRVKLESGMFWINGDKLGTSFLAQLHQLRRVFVYRDRPDPNDKAGRAVWSYDQQTTTQGESLKTVFEGWAAEGFESPTVKEVSEVVAELKDTDYAGNLVMLAIPHQSTNRMAGYRDRLRITRGLRPTQVITRVSVGGPIKSGSTTFTPWQFDFYAEA